MKLFNLFKKNKPLQSPAVNRSETITEKVLRKETSQISEKNKKYYQDDSYYTTTYNDIMGKPQNVITFEDRKKTCIPTSQGLYVAEILLLDYCSKGKYPNPQYGYPGFWWFEYGIRDVDKALKELENRGFITWTPLKDLINNLKVEDIKKLLSAHSQPITGNKPQLIDRLIGVISDDELLNAGLEPKYKLTETGNSELQENAYVPYMHKHSKYNNFTIWDLNKILEKTDKNNYVEVINSIHNKLDLESHLRHEKSLIELKATDPQKYKAMKMQDDQIKAVLNADKKYALDKDVDWIIQFWENIWNSGGLLFDGSNWIFKLANLYIGANRYEDAINFCQKIKKQKPFYSQRADQYICYIKTILKIIDLIQKTPGILQKDIKNQAVNENELKELIKVLNHLSETGIVNKIKQGNTYQLYYRSK